MKTNLTDLQVKKLGFPETGVVEVTDADAPGLILRATASRKKLWMVRYCPKGGKQRRVGVGQYPSMSLAQARVEAREYDRLARLGRDRRHEEEAGRAAEALKARTLDEVLRTYVEEYCKRNQRAWRHTQRMFDNHVVGSGVGRKRLVDVTRGDIVDHLQRLLRKGLTAQVNRVHTQVKAALNWAIERGWLEHNPADHIKRQYGQEQPRDRVLTPEELRALWTAADRLPDPSRTLVKMWMLTGQRRDEVRKMEWREVDLGQGIWRLPASRTKSKTAHDVPLPTQAVRLLEAMPRLGDTYVFTTDGEKPYAGQKRLKDILDREAKTAEWPHWTFHDFRRTAATGMAELRTPDDIIARVLNHARRDITSLHYNRHAYEVEKRRALQAWADHLTRVVTGEQGKVVALRKRGQPRASA